MIVIIFELDLKMNVINLNNDFEMNKTMGSELYFKLHITNPIEPKPLTILDQ